MLVTAFSSNTYITKKTRNDRVAVQDYSTVQYSIASRMLQVVASKLAQVVAVS